MKRLLALTLCLCAGLAAAQEGLDLPRIVPQAELPVAQKAPEHAEILVMFHLPAPHFRADSYGSADYREDAGKAARKRIATAVAHDYQLELMEDWAMPVLNVDCYRMRLRTGQSAEPVLEALSRDRRIEWAQVIQDFVAQAGSDPLYRMQPAAGAWQLDEVRKAATGRKVTVAVVDSGVESHHPDLEGQVALEENFVDGQKYVPELHGTAVAGVIAARAGNGVGIEGVAPDARLLALRACWQAGSATRCNSFTLAKAMNFALSNGAQVINLSLSGPQDRLLQQLVEAAQQRGIRVVGAVDPARADGGFPASLPGVFAVASDGANTRNGTRTLLAPGRDIPTTMPGGRWGLVTGSSYAAAHVSGMLALLEELKPQMPAARLREGIVLNEGSAPLTGIDLCATIIRITGKCSCACQPSSVSRYARSP
ncbi:S8 family serine peptidase [Duganella sp. FT80W]|uniref:S8 family serine peptidase n=1 Tax=Duganella guangzhouensis TaxID=2666084 RepID=A0A6I2L422_9BURK|nr:S8 family serine peptidase [Duganella guangzhouensis]MRW92490.1 S8 family serine peptidase [Duganella guangzhouensis]